MFRACALLPLCLLFVPTTWAAEPEKKSAKAETLRAIAEIKPSARGKGISVHFPKEISASATGPHAIPIRFANLLQEEVFLSVGSWEFNELGYSLWSNDGELGVGAGGGASFPDGYELLRKLSSCHYNQQGEARLIGSGFAYVTGKIDFGNNDLSEFVGGSATIHVPVQGYFRATGKTFSESVEFRVRIVK